MSTILLHSVSVAGVTFDQAGRALLIKRRDNGQWQAPGGILELNETLEQGVVREVLEETGVSVEVEHLSGIYKNMAKGVVAIVFRCRPLQGEPVSTDESRESQWVDVHSISKMMAPAFAVRVSDAWAAQGGGPPIRAHNGVDLL